MSASADNGGTLLADSVLPWLLPAWDDLWKQRSENRLSHAYLLQGTVSLEANDAGQSVRFARILAKLWLCESPTQTGGCGHCASCQWIASGTHPDLVELSPQLSDSGKQSRVIRIDQVRAAIDKVQQTSMHGGTKVLVIYPVDALNVHAANALLKSLEEPPLGTHFILVANKPSRVLATIRSRCQKCVLPQPSHDVARQWLSGQVPVTAEVEQLLVLSRCDPLQVLWWHEQGQAARIISLESDLSKLAKGGISITDLAAEWKKDGVADRIRWWWLWLSLRLKTDQVDYASTRLRRFIFGFMDQLLQCGRYLDSVANPNEQLMLESLLIDWENMMNDKTQVRA